MNRAYYTTHTVQLEIKPCPFCGAAEDRLAISPVDGELCVHCLECGVKGPKAKNIVDPRDGDAVLAWNERSRCNDV